jgi:uncharacterized YigZ family protein
MPETKAELTMTGLGPAYFIPAIEKRSEIIIKKSRFISTVAPVFTVEEAKEFILRIRNELRDASHHVPAYIIGSGSTTIMHCSDDGEPSGTAGKPALSVLKGSGLGDIAVVITRYFGGMKLGTGGLVQAYGDSVKTVLTNLPRAQKIFVHIVMLSIPYTWLDRMRMKIKNHQGTIVEETFALDIGMILQFPVTAYPAFEKDIQDSSNGKLSSFIFETKLQISPVP